jgi:2,4-dienoyl-CoA reductase-like NADH-dependent reductase (Old Yellow Enzyme family)
MTLLESFLTDVEAFLSERHMEASLFGRNALKDPNFVFDLRKGRCPNLRTIQRVRAFMAAYSSKPARAESHTTSRLERAT